MERDHEHCPRTEGIARGQEAVGLSDLARVVTCRVIPGMTTLRSTSRNRLITRTRRVFEPSTLPKGPPTGATASWAVVRSLVSRAVTASIAAVVPSPGGFAGYPQAAAVAHRRTRRGGHP